MLFLRIVAYIVGVIATCCSINTVQEDDYTDSGSQFLVFIASLCVITLGIVLFFVLGSLSTLGKIVAIFLIITAIIEIIIVVILWRFLDSLEDNFDEFDSEALLTLAKIIQHVQIFAMFMVLAPMFLIDIRRFYVTLFGG